MSLQSEFENAYEGSADVMALRKIIFQSKPALRTEEIVNNAQPVDFSTAEIHVQYLDKAHERLLTFRGSL